MEIKRGEIYWIESKNSVGSELAKKRPGVVVSNNIGNDNAPVVSVVYLTTQEKQYIPTHHTIEQTSSGDCEGSIALCEQVNTISKNRICDYAGRVSEEDMQAVDKAIMVALDLDRYIGNGSMPPPREEKGRTENRHHQAGPGEAFRRACPAENRGGILQEAV